MHGVELLPWNEAGEIPAHSLPGGQSRELDKPSKMTSIDVSRGGRCIVEAGQQDAIAEDKDASAMVVALRFDVGIGHEEHGKD